MGSERANAGWCVGPYDDPDRYELIERRSQGGQADLWLGRVALGRIRLPVAIKVFRSNRRLRDGAIERSGREEAELLRCLEHPNLPRVREFFAGPSHHGQGEADPATRTFFLVMNWVDGTSLDEWTSEEVRRPLADVLAVIEKVAEALDYLHGGRDTQGVEVVHRDVTPDNVIIKGNDVTLVDFSLARLAGGPMTFGGKPSYLAPEVLEHGRFGPASDRYALGITTCFSLLEGRLPDDRSPATLRRFLAVRLGPDSHGFVDVVLEALEARPERRPANAGAWVRELKRSAMAITPRPSPTEPVTAELAALTPGDLQPEGRDPPGPPRATRRPRRRLPIVFIVVGLAFGTGVGLLIERIQRQPAPPRDRFVPGREAAAGRYRTSAFTPRVDLELGGGWTVKQEVADLLEIVRTDAPDRVLQIVDAQRVYKPVVFATSEEARGAIANVNDLPERDLARWLGDHFALRSTPATVAFMDVALHASLDVTVARPYPYEGCPKGPCVLLLNLGPYEGRSEFYPFTKSAGERSRMAIVRLGRTQGMAPTTVVVIASAPQAELDAFLALANRTLRIDRIGQLT